MKTPAPAVPDKSLVKQRQDGLALIDPIKIRVVALVVKTAEDYELADGLLDDIRNRRRQWKEANLKASDEQRRALAAQKRALKAYEEVYEVVDGPLEEFELSVKSLMRDYKMEEARLLQEAETERLAKVAELEREAKEKEQRAAQAKTTAMKAKLSGMRAELEQRIADGKRLQPAKTAVKAVNSAARKTKKWRVDRLPLLLQYVLAQYTGHVKFPDDPNYIDLTALLCIDEGQMNAYFKLCNPAVGPWLPGVECWEDITIAGR